jgi:hypothetical protein
VDGYGPRQVPLAGTRVGHPAAVPNDEPVTTDPSTAAGVATATEEATAQAVERLTTAAATGVPCAPVRDIISRDDVAGANRIQQQIIAAAQAGGARRVGRKIGLTWLQQEDGSDVQIQQ